MAQPGETIRLVELVCARLCHDLGGLIGTVGNAIDMVAEDADRADEVLAFASSAAKALTQRLRLMRAAWGPETEPLALSALLALATPVLASRRIGFDTRTFPADCVFPLATGRLVLNLIVLASDCLPRGGTITLLGGPSDLMIRIDGPAAAWPKGLALCLSDEAEAIAAATNAQSIQMPLTALLAFDRKLILSPVMATTAGIVALRLVTP
jgi:histidine phosphotransferase ChpT